MVKMKPLDTRDYLKIAAIVGIIVVPLIVGLYVQHNP
jgi:hypothetical protein